MKKYIKYGVFILSFTFVIVGCIRINIHNTNSLSPIGNSDENFETVSNEFGDDFTEFIMDDSPVKIYIGEEGDGESIVKIGEREVNLTIDNQFLNIFTPLIDFIDVLISSLYNSDGFDANEESIQVDVDEYDRLEDGVNIDINNN